MRLLTAACAGLVLTLALALVWPMTGAALAFRRAALDEREQRLRRALDLLVERCASERDRSRGCLDRARLATQWLEPRSLERLVAIDERDGPLAWADPDGWHDARSLSPRALARIYTGERAVRSSPRPDYNLVALYDNAWGDYRSGPKGAAETAADALLRSAGGALLMAITLSLLMLRPLELLCGSARRVADGDLTVRVPERPPNELGQLAREFNRMTDVLARKARERDDFLARMTHDLRSPVNAMLLHADALRRQSQGPPADALDGLEAEGRRLVEEVEDVLELTRLEACPARPTLEPLDLRTELASAISRQGGDGSAFSCHALPGAARVRADTLALGPALDYALRMAKAWASPQQPVRASVYRGKPGELVLALGFAPPAGAPAACAALPARPQEGSSRVTLSCIDEVRWLRAARLLEAAGGTIELKGHDDGSWSVRIGFEDATRAT